MKRTLEAMYDKLNDIVTTYKKNNPKKSVGNSYKEIEKEINFDETISVIPTKLGYSIGFWFSGLIIIAL